VKYEINIELVLYEPANCIGRGNLLTLAVTSPINTIITIRVIDFVVDVPPHDCRHKKVTSNFRAVADLLS
jgi:hypothetical protein